MLRFRQMKTLQKFASVHANVHNQLGAPPLQSTSLQGTPLGRPGRVARSNGLRLTAKDRISPIGDWCAIV
jgi:hypothetical protein